MRRRKKILIVDCDADYLMTLERGLEEAGFDTTTTWDPWEAKALLNSGEFHALLVGEHPPEVKAKDILSGLAVPVACVVLQAKPRHPFEAQHLGQQGASLVVSRQKVAEVIEKVQLLLKPPQAASAGAA